MSATVLVVHGDRVGIATDAEGVRWTTLPPVSALPIASDESWADAAAAVIRGAGSGPVIVVLGLDLLDVAQPELPPLDARTRRALLARDADRYFPIAGAASVAWRDGFAFAMPEARLAALLGAIERVASIRAVTTIVDAVAESGADGVYDVGGATEQATITMRDASIASIVREQRSAPAEPLARSASVDTPLARGARRLADAPIAAQFLDRASAHRLAARHRRRWAASAAVFTGTVLLALWSLDGRAERALVAQRAAVERARAETARPRATLRRLGALSREIEVVAASRATELSATLDRLGRVLPADAWVERLEWTGSEWRIDGSADNAPRLVPLLDADPSFEGVRTVEATTRFLDRGRARESFAIAFRASAPSGSRVRTTSAQRSVPPMAGTAGAGGGDD